MRYILSDLTITNDKLLAIQDAIRISLTENPESFKIDELPLIDSDLEGVSTTEENEYFNARFTEFLISLSSIFNCTIQLSSLTRRSDSIYLVVRVNDEELNIQV